jgi:DNA-binding transcriptional ArsR family regulator
LRHSARRRRAKGCAARRLLLTLRVRRATSDARTALDKKSCQARGWGVRDIEVIEDPRAAEVALDPARSLFLRELAVEPASAAALAARVGTSRQRANYHLKALEEHGLVELHEVRMRGGIAERVLRATAASYVVSPAAIGDGARPEQVRDRLSAQYLVALAARVVREVGSLARRAEASRRRLPTFTLDTEVRFASAGDRAAFADELTAAVLDLVARYHRDDGRPHRLVVAAHPKPTDEPQGRPSSLLPNPSEETS